MTSTINIDKLVVELVDKAKIKFNCPFFVETTTHKRVARLFVRFERTNPDKAIKVCKNAWRRTKTPTRVKDAESLSRLISKWWNEEVTTETVVKILQKALK